MPETTPRQKFEWQRKNVLKTGGSWELSFDEWMRIWNESGHWDGRGRGRYVMARRSHAVAFNAANVQIITNGQKNKNAADGKRWGLTLTEFQEHVERYGGSRNFQSPMGRFVTQRKGARRRGVVWAITFNEWWQIWLASERWDSRGIQLGEYVMARFGDRGPYAVGNVEIITAAQNVKDGHVNRIEARAC